MILHSIFTKTIDWRNTTENLKTSGYVELGPGIPDADGNFRLIVVGEKIEIQKRESGNWVFHFRIP